MRSGLLTTIVLMLHLYGGAQKHSAVSGYVMDRLTGEPVIGATIIVNGSESIQTTDLKGFFKIIKLQTENYSLTISHIGYQTLQWNGKAGKDTTVQILLDLHASSSEEVVLTASKRLEQISRAPASIRLIGRTELERFAGSNISELLTNVQGIEMVRSGINMVTFNARGFNAALNNKFFFMIDGRNSMSSISTGVGLFSLSSVSTEDVERIEVIVGPHAALYGPNVHNGLVYVSTKDPRIFPGTTIAVTAGNHRQFSSRLRLADTINSKWAYKFNGEYSTGRDFIFYDSVRAGGGVYGPAVSIPERNVDFDFRNLKGEAHLYYNMQFNWDLILSAGASSNDFIGVNSGGRNQMKDLSHYFIQGRLTHPRFFANIYHVWTDISNSFNITSYTRDYYNRTHSTLPSTDPRGLLTPDLAEIAAKRMFMDKGQRSNMDLQYNQDFTRAGIFLVAGASYQRELPRSFGTTLLDRDERIKITQYGFVLHIEKKLPGNFRGIITARLDHHSNFGNFVSPKLAIVKNLKEGSFRISWSKAYSTPSILHQYSNGNFQSFGNGQGIFFIPNGANIHDAPARTAPLNPEEISTIEMGYKNKLLKKFSIDVNAYHGLSINFLGPLQNISGRVIKIGNLPIIHNPNTAGEVTNDTLRKAEFSTYFNFGRVRGYGVDLALRYDFNEKSHTEFRYSFFDSDRRKDKPDNDADKDGIVSEEEKSLNAPRYRLVLITSLEKISKNDFFVTLTGRYTPFYDFYSGNQVSAQPGAGTRPPRKNFNRGPLGGFLLIDLSAGLQLNKATAFNVGITNLFNSPQLEYVGSPPIGRLISVELRFNLDHSDKLR